jgi:hypothetical protein
MIAGLPGLLHSLQCKMAEWNYLYWLQLPFLVKGISGHQMSIIGFLSSQTTSLSKQNTMLNCILGAYMCFKFSPAIMWMYVRSIIFAYGYNCTITFWNNSLFIILFFILAAFDYPVLQNDIDHSIIPILGIL